MVERRRTKAFTLVEVLVVAFLCLFLLVLVPPVLYRPRSYAFGMTCGAKLAGIGKAMLIYANDYEDVFPRAGGRQSPWVARVPNWKAADRCTAYGIIPGSGEGGRVSISASLYLLVKYAEVLPKSFVCTGEEKVTEFDLAKMRGLPKDFELIDAWDFGPEPPKHVSYAYHMVYGQEELTGSGNPGMAILSERNPWMDSPFAQARDFALFTPDIAPFNGTTQAALRGNAQAHHGDGQNVLFVDSHVEFAKRAFCGVDDDNIYTSWDGADKVRGLPAQFGSVPAGPTDALLVNDPPIAPKSP
jgi:prepilin-type processing-associated H-X9-DG protein